MKLALTFSFFHFSFRCDIRNLFLSTCNYAISVRLNPVLINEISRLNLWTNHLERSARVNDFQMKICVEHERIEIYAMQDEYFDIELDFRSPENGLNGEIKVERSEMFAST